MEHSPFFVYNQDFTLFGTQHVSVMVLMVVLAIALPVVAKKFLSPEQQIRLSRGMGVFISFWAVAYVLILLFLGDFNYKTDLPLDICNMTALVLPFVMWNPSYRIYEILYFWILAGTLQAIITPHLFNGFPHFIFIKYWVVHAGLVVYIIYATVVFDFKPNLRSIWRAFIFLQVYVLAILGINLLLGSNYVYVLRKPPTASALDYLGPWPWYILVGELVGLLLFFLVYLPLLPQKIKRGSNQ